MLHFKSIKKNSPPKTRKTRSSVFHTDMPPQYWVSSIGGTYHSHSLFLIYLIIYFSFINNCPNYFLFQQFFKFPYSTNTHLPMLEQQPLEFPIQTESVVPSSALVLQLRAPKDLPLRYSHY